MIGIARPSVALAAARPAEEYRFYARLLEMRRRQPELQAHKTPTTTARTDFAAQIVARSGTDRRSAQRRTRGSRQRRERKDWPPAYVQCQQTNSAATARWRRAR